MIWRLQQTTESLGGEGVLWGPAPSIFDSEVQGWAQGFTFLTSDQTTLMLLSGDYTLRMTEKGNWTQEPGALALRAGSRGARYLPPV